MSAMGGIVGMQSADEIAAGGSVVPLRPGSPPVEPVQHSGSPGSAIGPISPELAMVDPEPLQEGAGNVRPIPHPA